MKEFVQQRGTLDFKLRDHSLEILKVYNQKSMNSYLFPLLLD